jgi:predicted DNA-binding antitoxin AbrB/MazE fold protein
MSLCEIVLSAALSASERNWIRYKGRVEKTVEAVYEHGVLGLPENPGLAEGQHVRVTISDLTELADASDCFEPAEWAAAREDDISLKSVRHALSGIRGSLSDIVIGSREERS